jgi:hypothetical protein
MNKAFLTDEEEIKRMFEETRLPSIRLDLQQLTYRATAQAADTVRPLRRRNKWLLAMCAMALVIVMFGTAASIPASAERLQKLPFVGSLFDGNIFAFFGDSGIVNGQRNGLTTEINKSASDQGITITLQEIMYDGARLSIGYEIKSDQLEHVMFIQDVTVSINNGDRVWAGAESKPHMIDDNHAAGILTLDLADAEWEDQFDLKLDIGEVIASGLRMEDRVNGHWSFRFSVVNQSLAGSTYKRFENGPAAKSDNGIFEVTGYRLTPTTTQLSYRFTGQTDRLLVQVKDDKGMILDWLGSRGDTEGDLLTGTARYAALPEGSKSISVTPYYLLQAPSNGEEPIYVKARTTDALPIILEQGPVGRLIVKNIDFLKDKTLVYYEVQGKNPQLQSLWLETEGGQFILANGNRTQISAVSYDYVQEYPSLDSKSAYVLGTTVQADLKLLEELTINLPIE